MPSLSSFPQSVQDEVVARMVEAVRNGEIMDGVFACDKMAGSPTTTPYRTTGSAFDD